MSVNDNDSLSVVLIYCPQDGEERGAGPPRVGDAAGEDQPSSPHN